MSWYDKHWDHRQKITIDCGKVDTEDLTDFPVLITEANLKAGFWTHVKSDGSDVVVTASNGKTKLKRELVAGSFSKSGHKLELYAKVPVLAHSVDTSIYLYYGNDAASETNDEDTWDEYYKAVYHMNDDPDNEHIKDSTANHNHGTKKGANEPVQAVGQVGKAQLEDGADDYISVAHHASIDFVDEDFTIEVMLKIAEGDLAAGDRIFCKGVGGAPGKRYEAMLGADNLQFIIDDHVAKSTTTYVDWTNWADNTWHLLAFRRDTVNNLLKIFNDGIEASSYTDGTGSIANASNLYLGTEDLAETPTYAPFSFDEFRISSTNRSEGWIATTNNTLMSPATFYSVGAEEQGPGYGWGSAASEGYPYFYPIGWYPYKGQTVNFNFYPKVTISADILLQAEQEKPFMADVIIAPAFDIKTFTADLLLMEEKEKELSADLLLLEEKEETVTADVVLHAAYSPDDDLVEEQKKSRYIAYVELEEP